MPWIFVENCPKGWRNTPGLTQLLLGLRRASVEAGVPGIDSVDKVWPVPRIFEWLDGINVLKITVEDLFAREDRKKLVRDRLALALYREAMKHVPPGWKVEVTVRVLDREVDTFVDSDPESEG